MLCCANICVVQLNSKARQGHFVSPTFSCIARRVFSMRTVSVVISGVSDVGLGAKRECCCCCCCCCCCAFSSCMDNEHTFSAFSAQCFLSSSVSSAHLWATTAFRSRKSVFKRALQWSTTAVRLFIYLFYLC